MGALSDLYSEARVATKLGLTRRQLKGIREELTEGEDWTLVDHTVALTSTGLAKLCAAHDLPTTLDFTDCSLAKKNAAAETVKFTVVRVFPNRRLLLALQDGAAQPALVRVKDNSNFRPRMTLHARPADMLAGAQTYELVGPLPRTPGRY